jgi:1A family penicillin-binding protein
MPKRKYYRFIPPEKPANKKRVKKKFSLSLKRFLGLALKIGFLGAFLFLILMVGVFAYYAKGLPEPQDILENPLTQSTKIYDRSEKVLLYEVYQDEKRTVVGIDEISPFIKNAIISIEDKDFYKHPGIDFKGLVRSAWVAIKTKGQYIQGASTITQQFIKNSLLSPKRTISRKVKEIILSLELERKYSKDEILAFYLNQVSFGSNAYGVESASKTFFAKNASDVTLAEAAILAALPKAPTRLSPYGNNPDLLKQRQELILHRMKILGYITEDEKEKALEEKIEFQQQRTGIKAPHFVMYIKEILEEKYGKDVVEKSGLRVITTLDWKLQEKAEEIVVQQTEKNEKNYGAKNSALVAINPKTGEILSMVGSRDYFDIENDGNVNVVLRERQPGSAFKPFAYAAAFEKGYTPDTLLFDVKTEFNPYCVYSAVQSKDKFGLDCYHPQNYDLKERGPITMRSALAQSLNIPSVKTLYLAGVENSIDLAEKMGIATLKERKRFGLALVLGGGEVKLIDITSSFGVFAAEGKKAPVYSIIKVEDNEGNVLEEHKEENSKQVLDKNTCRIINSILSDNEARAPMFGSSSYLSLGDIPVAAKTGTTQEYRDGWTIGYTPNLAVGVWTGNNDNSSMTKMAGVTTAGPIWHDFMVFALQDRKKLSFTPPTIIQTNKAVLSGNIGGEIVKIDTISGKRATESTPPHLIEERIYHQAHSILYYVSKDNPKGSIPENPEIDPQFKNWEAAIKSWANDPERGNWTDEIPPEEYDDIHINANKPVIKILSPKNGTIIESANIKIKTEIRAENNIKQVDFFFDEDFLGSKISTPYEWPFTLVDKNDLSGRHKLTVKAYDVCLNSNEKSVNIYTNINGSSGINNEEEVEPKLTLFNPNETDFPYTINLTLQGEFDEVRLYYSAKEDLSNSYFITKDWQKLSQENYQYIWNDPGLEAGNYYLYVLGEDENENIVMSNKVLIKILKEE